MKETLITRSRSIFEGSVQVYCLGRWHGLADWSIRPLKTAGDFLSAEGLQVFDQIRFISPVNRLYAPVPTKFNAEICRSDDLKVCIGTNDFAIYRGVEADGCDIPKGSGFWLSSADCATVVMQAPDGFTLAMHVGLKSLYDHEFLFQGKPRRRHESVIAGASTMYRNRKCLPGEVSVAVIAATNQLVYPPCHEKFGSLNKGILWHFSMLFPENRGPIVVDANSGTIFFKNLIRRELDFWGFKNIEEDDVDTATDRDEKENFSGGQTPGQQPQKKN